MNTDGHSRLNNIYHAIKTRCYNPNFKNYKYYGGRGIKVCDEWASSFENFKNWAITHGYADNLTIDRIDNNKGYSPLNCRWITLKKQSRNKRNNHLVTYQGKTQPLIMWCEELGLSYSIVNDRINKLQWPVEKAFEIKDNPRLKQLEYKGRIKSLSEWCKELNLNYSRVRRRLNSFHWSVEKAFEVEAKKWKR